MALERTDFDGEQRRLEKVYQALQKQLSALEQKGERLNRSADSAADDYSEAIVQRELSHGFWQKAGELSKALEKPYFARCDFREEDGGEESVYLGRTSIASGGAADAQLVYDWRAPVADLFYDGQLGETSYRAPKGVIAGELLLKRQYDISAAKLRTFFDSDISGSNQMLEQMLGKSSNSKMQDIISTIQREQNQVIRESPFTNLVIQGVAGSGKTSVLLHRISYLLYNYQKSITPDDILFFGPSKLFLEYIENVLPDIGASSVQQTTIAQWMEECVEECGYRLEPGAADGPLADRLTEQALEFRESYDLSAEITQALAFALPFAPTCLDGFRDSAVRLGLSGAIKNARRQLFRGISTLEKEGKLTGAQAEAHKREIRQALNAFRFQRVLEDFYRLVGGPRATKKLPASYIRPFLLLYLHYHHKLPLKHDYKLLFLDEAQDVSESAFRFLCAVFDRAAFNLAGDLMQSLEEDLCDWRRYTRAIGTKAQRNQSKAYYLSTAYRTTNQIADLADRLVAKWLPSEFRFSRLKIRDGEPPCFQHLSGPGEERAFLASIIDSFQGDCLAIIEPDPQALQQILEWFPSARLLTPSDQDAYSGVVVATPSVAKGLEFDQVVLPLLDRYRLQSFREYRHLYIAVTRTVNRLYLGLSETLASQWNL